jgi:hypothetical protein
MSLTAKRDNSDFPPIPPVPAGMCQAVCYSVVDLGTHRGEYQGKPNKRHLVAITWEIPEERITIVKDGKEVDLPRAISKKYTLSLGDKAKLFADLTSWRGKAFTEEELKGFELERLLGVNCVLNIIHAKSKEGDKIYANIASISPLMKNMQKAKPENPLCYFELKSRDIPALVPKWLVEEIKKSEEYLAMDHAADVLGGDEIAELPDDFDSTPEGNESQDIPF